jgi:hypothetical protein
MFAQLLKHEFKATRRIIPWIYLVTVFMIATGLLANRLNIQWLTSLLVVLIAISGLACVLMTYVLIIYRYYKHLYNSEGYLTHTLPVRSGQILGSKVLAAFIWLLLSYLLLLGVMLTLFLVVSGQNGRSISLGDVWRMAPGAIGLTGASFNGLIMAAAAYICLSIFYLLAQIYFAISLGSTSRFHSLGVAAPVLIWLGIYLVSQLGLFLFMILVPLGLTVENQTLQFVPRSMLVTLLHPDVFVFGLGSILFIILATVGLFFGTNRLIRRSTSLR